MPSDSACMGKKFIGKGREGERERETEYSASSEKKQKESGLIDCAVIPKPFTP